METIKNNAAYIIKRINDLSGESPGKKVLQKIVYLMIEKGIPLRYEYGLHFYGTYSASLDAATSILHADGIININYSGFSHKLGINDDVSVMSDGLTKEQEAGIDDVINTFISMSASDLELLTTAIYAYNHLEDKSMESVVEGVLKIKGTKYARDQIRYSLERFDYFNKNFA